MLIAISLEINLHAKRRQKFKTNIIGRLCAQSACTPNCYVLGKPCYKTSQECETALTSKKLKKVEKKVGKKLKKSWEKVKKKKLKKMEKNHPDQMYEGSQVSKVTLCVKILKW